MVAIILAFWSNEQHNRNEAAHCLYWKETEKSQFGCLLKCKIYTFTLDYSHMVKRRTMYSKITTENTKEWHSGFLGNLKIFSTPQPNS